MVESQQKEERLRLEMRRERKEAEEILRQEFEERFRALQSEFRSALEMVASKDRELSAMMTLLSEQEAKLGEQGDRWS
jgi:hypothetical protein